MFPGCYKIPIGISESGPNSRSHQQNNTVLEINCIRLDMLVSCTGLKSRPRPGPEIWFEAQARPGPAAVVMTRPGPGPQIELWGPGPARPATSMSRPGPQNNLICEAPARARGPRAGLFARSHRHTKQQLFYCVHILMGVVPMRRVPNGRGQFSACQWDVF